MNIVFISQQIWYDGKKGYIQTRLETLQGGLSHEERRYKQIEVADNEDILLLQTVNEAQRYANIVRNFSFIYSDQILDFINYFLLTLF